MSRQEKLAALASTGITKAELDNIDGGTARGTTAIADGDGVLINDAGTMRMTSVETMATYIGTKVGGGLEFISSTDISNAATASFTGFDSSKYDSYLFTCGNIVPATDGAVFGARMSVDGGSNYLSASDSYRQTAAAGYNAGDANIIPFLYYGFGNVSTEGGSLDVKINNPHLNTRTYAITNGGVCANSSDTTNTAATNGGTKVATVVNAVQFLFGSGNIASGTITMYGLVNS